MADAFGAMGIKAAVRITQHKNWYKWEGVVVVAVLPHKRHGSAWVVALDLLTSQLVYRRFDPSHHLGASLVPIGPKVPLERSERWNTRMSEAEVAAGGHDATAAGKAKVEFCIALHYSVDEQTLLGVDTGGLYQLWDMRKGGRQMLAGRFTTKAMIEGHPKPVTRFVLMNAFCHTPDWIVGATCLDEAGNTSSIFAINRLNNEQMPTIQVAVTGIKSMRVDPDKPDMIWMATDTGPFFIDTRYPHCLWAMLPGGRWIEALGIADMGPTMDVNRYVGRYHRCTQEAGYRATLEASDPTKPETLDPEVKADFEMVGYFNTKKYRLMDADVRPHYLNVAGDGQMLCIGDKMFSWTSMRDGKIIPGHLGGLLCGAFVGGGIVLVHEDRKIILVQAPWAKRDTEHPDYSEKTIARAFDASVSTVTRIGDQANADTNYMVAPITDSIVLVHSFDDGIYRYDVDDEPEPAEERIILDVEKVKEIPVRPEWMPSEGVNIGDVDGLMEEDGAAPAP